jgi:hemerythrin-like domain-containing protein
MSAIEMLEKEHRVIMRMVNVLTVMHKHLESGGDVDVPALRDVLDFFRTFADKGHHAKEEAVLFPTWKEMASVHKDAQSARSRLSINRAERL